MRRFILFIGILLVLSGCGRQPYEKFTEIQDRVWSYNQPKSFIVNIDKPGSYRLFLQLRYTQEYTYSNIWVGLSENKPEGKTETVRFNIPLFDAQGKPYGSFAGKFFDRNYPDADIDARLLPLDFIKAGQYTLTLQHNMRPDRLDGISEVGIRLKAL